MPAIVRSASSVVRWWFGSTYFVAGVGCVIVSPVMLARGNYGGVYMAIGGVGLAALGYLIHPWGRKRRSTLAG